MTMQLGYCTNVHAGADLATTLANLDRHAVRTRELFRPGGNLGIGLWLSAPAARELLQSDGLFRFAEWLAERRLTPFTLNGFPYGDFHQRVVKHRVYEPTWYQTARLTYTLELVEILDALLPVGVEGSISTLPICWGDPPPSDEQKTWAASNLRLLAERLAELEQQRGRRIMVCLEPEPGCFLQRGEDMVRYFEDYLLPGSNEEQVRRYLGICHDVCHAEVMFERQRAVLERYRRAGLSVGKVQVSSAVVLPPGTEADRPQALAQLAGFHEERYLHQTCIRTDAGEQPYFFEDLPLALAAQDDFGPESEWRVHFHMPVYLERFGRLATSRPAILECLAYTQKHHMTTHYEVETYAWGVLPEELRQEELAAGIAAELLWLEACIRPHAG
jgi:hypothetical protein